MRPDLRRRLGAPTTAAAEQDDYSWLVTFSDLVLQLFAFVIVCSALGSAVRPKKEPVAPPAPVVARPAAPAMPRVAAAPAPTPAPAPRLDAVAARLRAVAAASVRPDDVSVKANGTDVTLSLGEAIGFPSSSADLLAGATPILDEVRRLADAMPDLQIAVEGHTDDRPIQSGRYPSNLELSLARAARVAQALGADDPALRARIVATGMGEHRPVASNADPEGRARNRRVEIRLVPAH
ncbi:MAG TPA: OmpA family protein [Candidatus Binatia bacterium]|jgi:flagellar motor protein MotB|nr:OmpA family protein [Candidatus Binatia bacterium]